MADGADFPQPDWMANLPVMSLGRPRPEQPNLFTAALASGAHQAVANIGGTGQAIGTALGLQGMTDWGASVAEEQRAMSEAAGREDLERQGFGTFKGALYGITKGVPVMAGAMAPLAIPGIGEVGAAVGAGAMMVPQAIGENVEAARQAHPEQSLSGADAAKALLLGGAEGVAQSFIPKQAGTWLKSGAAGNFLPRVAGGALKLGAYQGVLGGVQTAITQQAYTPDMPASERAKAVVNAALSGGLQGAVFGGLTSLRRATLPVTAVKPETVTTEAVKKATDPALLQLPPPAPRDLPLGEPGVPHSTTPSPELVGLSQKYVDRGKDITDQEKIQQALVQGEIARRTVPGFVPGDPAAPVRTAEQMQALSPQIDATKRLAVAAAGGEASTPPPGAENFFNTLGASSEPELVNSITVQAGTYAKDPSKAPRWFRDLAENYGVKIGDTGRSPAEMLIDYNKQEQDLMAERDAAVKTRNISAIRTASRALSKIQDKKAEADRLLALHTAAEDHLEQARPAPPEEPGAPAPDEAVAPPEPPAPPGPTRDADVAAYHDTLLSKMSPGFQKRVAPVLAQLDAANTPEMIRALRQHLAAVDQNREGVLSPEEKYLMSRFGITDSTGRSINLLDKRAALEKQYNATLKRADAQDKAGKAGQADILRNEAQFFKDTSIKANEDLIRNHDLADDLDRVVPPVDVPAPEGTPPELVKPWEMMEHVKEVSTTDGDSKLALEAEQAQTAILQGSDRAREIMEPVTKKFTNKQKRKPKVVPPAEPSGIAGFTEEMRRQDEANRVKVAPPAEVPAPPTEVPAPPTEVPALPATPAALVPDFSGEYPGDAAAAKALNLPEPDWTKYPVGARDATRKAWQDRMQLLWSKAGKGQFDQTYASTFREARAYEGNTKISDADAVRPDGTPVLQAKAPPVSRGAPSSLDAIVAEIGRRLTGAPVEPEAIPVTPTERVMPAEGATSLTIPAALETASKETYISKAVAAAEAVNPREGHTPWRETERLVNELGSNIGGKADAVQASREGGAAFRADRENSSLIDNPYKKAVDPDAWEAWREGWRTARRPTHVTGAQKAPAIIPRRLPEIVARDKVAEIQRSGDLTPAQQADFDRTAVQAAGGSLDAWSRFENRLALARELSGEKAGPAPLPVRPAQVAPTPEEPATPAYRSSEPPGRGHRDAAAVLTDREMREAAFGQQVKMPSEEAAPRPAAPVKASAAERFKAFRDAQVKVRGEPVPPVEEPAPAPVPPVAEPVPPPEWVAGALGKIGGDFVNHDGEHALIRGFNKAGKSVFLPVSKAMDRFGLSDIRSSTSKKLAWLSQEARDKLTKWAEDWEAADKAKALEVPEGPFTGASRSVIGTKSADPRIVDYVSNLLHMVGLGDTKVLVSHPDDVRGVAGDALGLYGEYMRGRETVSHAGFYGFVRSFGPGHKDFQVHVDPALSDTMKIESASHEVGHIIFEAMKRNAPPEVREALKAAHLRWFKETRGLNAQDLILATRNRETSQVMLEGKSPDLKIDQINKDYLSSETEWFADNVSRWATTAEKPRTLLDRFFSAVAEKIRGLLSAITGSKFLPDPVVKEFLDHLAGGSTQWLGNREGSRIPMSGNTGARNVPEANVAVSAALRNIGEAAERVSEVVQTTRAGVFPWLRRQALGWETLDGIVRIAGDLLKSARQWADTHTLRQVLTDAKNKADARSVAPYIALGKTPARAEVNKMLYMLNDGSGIDARKGINDAANRWILTDPNSAKLIAKYNAQKSQLDTVRTTGGRPAMDGILQMMQTKGYQAVTAMLHTLGETWTKRGVTFEGHGVNPEEIYRGMTGARGHDSPDATNLYFKNTARTMLDGITKYIADEDDKVRLATKNPKAVAGGLDSLRAQADLIQSRMDQANKGTYSPLGRGEGNYFVSGQLVTGPDGRPTAAATQALQAALEKAGFHDVGVIHDTASNTVMTRVETIDLMKKLGDVFEQLGLEGHMEPATTKMGYPESLDTLAGLGPKYMKAIVESINEEVDRSGAPAELKDQLKAQMVTRMMDMLPDQSVLHNLEERTYASGFSKEMGDIAIRSALSQSRAATALSMHGAFARAAEVMRSEVQDAKMGLTGHPIATQDVAKELWLREAQQAWRIPSNGFDRVQNWMHTLRIGFNPPYILTMMSQIPTLLHPELAKKMGYGNSAAAIFRATPRAFKILKAVLASSDRTTVGFRETVLRAAGIAEDDIKVIMDLDNRGGLSNATWTSHMSDLIESEGSKYKRMANAMGLYAEMIPRVVGALAAKDLYDKRPVKGVTREQYVHDVVTGSQYNWGAGQSSRQTGKAGGLFGPASRIMLAFTSYQTKMIEKLYTESHTLLSAGKSAEERKEAGRFLAAHAVAMTAVAGTMGLPLAGAIAGVLDKLAYYLLGKDDVDTEGLYRTWLTHTFGADVGDVVSKGLPRALGVDLSHLGEGRLIPGTSILQDKRRFEDASRDWLRSLAGSALGEATDLYLGARDAMNGDYLKGAVRVMPEGAKGIGEAIYFSEHGYRDKNGVEYPLKPSARDILISAMGLDPSNLAQYNEAVRIKSGLMDQREYRAQNITSHLMRGMLDPGSTDTNHWMQEAVEYTRDHPGLPGPLQGLAGRIQGAYTHTALAQALHTPLGVPVLDLGIQSATGFLQ